MAHLSFSPWARSPHVRLPASLECNEVVARALGVFKRLAQFVEGAEAEVEVGDHLGVARMWLIDFAWFGGHQGRTRYRDEEEHEGCAEDDGHDLAIHPSEGVVFLVGMEETGDSGCRFHTHAPCMVISRALARTARLDVALGDPGPVEEDNDLVVLHAASLLVTCSVAIMQGGLLKDEQMR